jgi:hypothetical protein
VHLKNIRIDPIHPIGQSLIEKPVVHWKEDVRGEAWEYRHTFHRSRRFEACFRATVYPGVNVIQQSLRCFNYAAFYATKVQMRWLSVENAQTDLRQVFPPTSDNIFCDFPGGFG